MSELIPGHELKAGDAPTLEWDLGLDIAAEGYTSATVLIARPGKEPIVYRDGVISGTRVSIELTSEETAIPGEYRAEVKLHPGPVTHPSRGWVRVRILPGPSGAGDALPEEWVAPGAFATAAQGVLAETALQPAGVHVVAFTGSYFDLTSRPSAFLTPDPENPGFYLIEVDG